MLRDSRLSSVWPSGGLGLVADKTTKKKKIKPRVDYEPRSAHGRAVNNNNNNNFFYNNNNNNNKTLLYTFSNKLESYIL